jgi:voltage-gated potassium channel
MKAVQRLIRPNVSDFLEVMVGKKGQQLVVEEIVVPEDSPLDGQTLEESKLRNKTGAMIAAFIDQDGQMVFNPGSTSKINVGSTMIVLGQQDALDKLSDLLCASE